MRCAAETIIVAFMMLASIQTAGCSERRVGGMTAEQEFSDPKVADLARSACADDVAALSQTLKGSADPNGKGRGGDTPLFWAVKCEKLDAIEALLNAGADPNYKIPGQFSATYTAATLHNPAPLKLLLKHGGDPNTRDESAPWTALSVALDLGLNGHGWDNYYALLKAGANINKADDVGNTIATTAAALGAFDKVVELLNRGYDYDLIGLGASVQARKIDASAFPEKATARDQVIKMLEARGVRFPIPPLIKFYSGRVRMTDDKTLIVLWGGGRAKNGEIIKPSYQTIEPSDPRYDDILKRVGGLKPGYGTGIPRLPDDPAPLAK
jgi:uncharacterized protein